MKTKTAFSRITSLLLSLALLLGMTPLTAFAEGNLPLGTSDSTTLGASTQTFGMTLFALGDYHNGDVGIINMMIANNGLIAEPNDPDSWTFATWSASTPKRLTTLDLEDRNLVGALDVSGLTSLTELNCNNNWLTALDVSGLTSLTGLNCNLNQLTSLDASGLTSLTALDCQMNQLTTLNVTTLNSLTTLNCGNNQLTTLDVSTLTSLTTLSCGKNQLTALNVSTLTGIVLLWCHDNQLATLNVSGLTSLSDLYCYENQLTALTLTGANALKTLQCHTNRLTSLDIPAPIALSTLDCRYNYMTNPADVTGSAGTVTFAPQSISTFVSVTGYTNFPTSGVAEVPMTLSPTLLPTTATNQTITWSIEDPGTTGATLIGNVLTTATAGRVRVRLLVVDGVASGVDYKLTTGIQISANSALTVTGGSGSGNYATGQVAAIAAPPAAGQQFKEWQITPAVGFTGGTGKTSANANLVMPAAPVTATAVYEYDITTQTDGNGTASANKTSAPAGEIITLTTTPNSGYRFKEWQVVSGGVSITNNQFTMPATVVTVKAIFEGIPPNEYAITIQTDGNGTATASKTSAPAGEIITLTATPSSGYRFKEWQVVSGVVSITNNQFTMPATVVTVKAIFEVVGTTSSGGSSSSSGGGGGGKADTRPTTPSKTNRPVTKAEATKLVDTALAAKPAGATTLSIKVQNKTSVTKEVLAELAASAKKNGVTLTVHFDTVVGGKVVGRISVNPALVTANLDLTVTVNKALAARFAKFYSNPLAAFTIKTGGSVAIPLPANLKPEGLVIYSYDTATNTYSVLPNAKPWVDKNGYLHFELPAGTEVVISQGKLAKK